MPLLALLRHAPTAWTEAGRLQGRADPPLSPRGRALARGWRLPPAIAAFAWTASPLRRCRETAALLAEGFAPLPPFAIEPRLIEMDWGAWEGERLAALRRRLGPAIAANEARGLDLQPPGGESPRAVQARLLSWLGERAGGPDCFAVTHRGVIRALYALASGWDMRGEPPARLEDGALQLFRLAADGGLAVERLNLRLAAPAGAPA